MTRLRLPLAQMLDEDEEVAEALGAFGYDVIRVTELGLACENDSEILAREVRDNRILLTLDERSGDWAVLPLSSHPGVIRV